MDTDKLFRHSLSFWTTMDLQKRFPGSVRPVRAQHSQQRKRADQAVCLSGISHMKTEQVSCLLQAEFYGVLMDKKLLRRLRDASVRIQQKNGQCPDDVRSVLSFQERLQQRGAAPHRVLSLFGDPPAFLYELYFGKHEKRPAGKHPYGILQAGVIELIGRFCIGGLPQHGAAGDLCLRSVFPAETRQRMLEGQEAGQNIAPETAETGRNVCTARRRKDEEICR